MISTLLLRLQGPMQSYGIESKFEFRETTFEPTKSGVLGMICCVLGRDRTDPVDDLVMHLGMAVRVDRPGRVEVDFHTALDIVSAEGSLKRGSSKMSYRYYLHDASFLVGLQSENEELLQTVHEAFQRPCRPAFLGRKSCPPATSIVDADSVVTGTVGAALRQKKHLTTRSEKLRFVVDKDLASTFESAREVGRYRRRDVPMSFGDRRFRERDVVVLIESSGEPAQ